MMMFFFRRRVFLFCLFSKTKFYAYNSTTFSKKHYKFTALFTLREREKLFFSFNSVVVPHKHMYTLRRSERTKRIQFLSSINHFFLSAYVFAALFRLSKLRLQNFFYFFLILQFFTFHISRVISRYTQHSPFSQSMP